MKRYVAVSVFLLILLYACMNLFSSFSLAATAPVGICIQTDGAVNPATAPIQRNGDVYTLTGNVENAIVIQKDGVTLDGAGYLVNGTSSSEGSVAVDVSNRRDVTVKNLRVGKSFDVGILVDRSSGITIENNVIMDVFDGVRIKESSGNTIRNNRITNVFRGIYLWKNCLNNILTQNSITELMEIGISLSLPCSGNLISKNTMVGQTTRGWSPSQGIEMVSGTNNTLEANTITSMFMAGIRMQQSSGNKIASNNIANAGFTGLSIEWSDSNTFTGNSVTDCRAEGGSNGILVADSANNVFRSNRIRNNSLNLYISGYQPDDWINDIDSSNTIEGKPVYYWIYQNDQVVPADAGTIVLVNCADITIRNSNFGKGQGIKLVYSSNCTITQNIINNCTVQFYSSSANFISLNTIAGNDRSISLEYNSNNNVISNNTLTGNNIAISLLDSSGNTLTGNAFANNKNALYFSRASNNSIYVNNFQNNVREVSDLGMNSWPDYSQSAKASPDSARAIETLAARVTTVNFMGPLPLSSNNWDNDARGNFWSDYNGTDANGDGIGDTAYHLYENNQDHFPLMKPVAVSEVPSAPVEPSLSTPASTGQLPENTTQVDDTGVSSGKVVPELPSEYVLAVIAAAVGVAAGCAWLFVKRRKVPT